MGLVPCPECGKREISDKAKTKDVPACPECYRPFDVKEWKRIDAQKDSDAQEAEIEKRETEAKANKAQKEGQKTIIVATGNPSRHTRSKG